MSEPKHIIQIRIRDLRRGRSLTQEELAEALGVSRQSINAMEAGRCLPSLPVAMQLASFFSVPLTNIFDLNESALSSMAQDLTELLQVDPVGALPLSGAPAVNLSLTAGQVIVELRVPGFAQEQLAIDVGKTVVVVEGRVAPLWEDSEYLQREFGVENFSRTVSLPVPVHSDRAEAELRQGILTICIPRVLPERQQTTRIQIRNKE